MKLPVLPKACYAWACRSSQLFYWNVQPTLVLFAVLMVSTDTVAGFFEPHMEVFEDCTSPGVVSGRSLAAQSKTSKLLFTIMTPSDGYVDAQLVAGLGKQGMVAHRSIDRKAPKLEKSSQIRFSGKVYVRFASLLEKVLGGGRDWLFYDVSIGASNYLLGVQAFDVMPRPICPEALKYANQ